MFGTCHIWRCRTWRISNRDATLKGATLEDAHTQEEADGLIGFELEKNFQVQILKFRLPELELAAKLSLR